MSFISIDEDESVLMLKASDFPNYYVDNVHPDDYKLTSTPFIEKLFHKKRFHNRLLMRICFKVDENRYVPVTFIVDTGSPMWLYLCPKAKEIVNHLIKIDEFETEYLILLSSPSQKEGKGDGNKKIPIRVIGIRPGEKVHEVLISSEEMPNVSESGNYYIIHPQLPELYKFNHAKCELEEYSSKMNIMNPIEVKTLLEKEKLL